MRVVDRRRLPAVLFDVGVPCVVARMIDGWRLRVHNVVSVVGRWGLAVFR